MAGRVYLDASQLSASRYAVLGVLSLGPQSGYDIRKLVAESIQHFWSESYGQIYPALKELETRGLVAAHSARGRGNRRVYSIAPAGRRALRQWLAEAPRLQPPRNELLLKLFFGPEGDAKTQQRHVRAVRERRAHELAAYERIAREIAEQHAGHPGLPYWLMTLDLGRSSARMVVAWCDRVLQQLDNISRSKAVAGNNGKRALKRKAS